jgi:uroporphyrinogen-III decarboxylase
MASSGAQSIAIDECMDLDFIGAVAQTHAIGFIGNLHVSAVLFEETEGASADVERCLAAGERFPGYVFGLGGPITQHIDSLRLEKVVAAYRERCRI